MTSLSSIHSFLEPKKMAIAGVSRNPKKFGRVVYEHLKKNGYELYPVNPNIREIDGQECYKSITEIPGDVDRVYIVTPSQQTVEIVKQSLERGIRQIWIQQKSESSEAMDLLKGKDINLIHNKCIFMFAEPVKGGHAFHRWLSRTFGSYPK